MEDGGEFSQTKPLKNTSLSLSFDALRVSVKYQHLEAKQNPIPLSPKFLCTGGVFYTLYNKKLNIAVDFLIFLYKGLCVGGAKFNYGVLKKLK